MRQKLMKNAKIQKFNCVIKVCKVCVLIPPEIPLWKCVSKSKQRYVTFITKDGDLWPRLLFPRFLWRCGPRIALSWLQTTSQYDYYTCVVVVICDYSSPRKHYSNTFCLQLYYGSNRSILLSPSKDGVIFYLTLSSLRGTLVWHCSMSQQTLTISQLLSPFSF